MNILLLYPLFPKSFWSFEKTLALLNRKAMLPPLGLVTVAAILPQDWEFKLVDRNVREVTQVEWDWADLVILSAMIVQKEDLLEQIQEAKRRGKRVAVGGPYATALPQEVMDVGADYMILDEGEITLPLFIEAIARGGDREPSVQMAKDQMLPIRPFPGLTCWNSMPMQKCRYSFREDVPSSASFAILLCSTVVSRAQKLRNNCLKN